MEKYTIIKNKINDNKIKYQFAKADNSKLTYAEFLKLIKAKDKDFLKIFRSELNQVPSDLGQKGERKAYVWKCVPVSKKTLNKEFEFIVLREDGFDNIKHDYSRFQEHFKGNSEVVSFSSLSGTTLIVPAPKKEGDFPCPYPGDENKIVDYKNIKEFTNLSSLEQRDELWQKVGEKMEEELNSGDTTRWLNTHGLDVPHLHVRLDKGPKYYQGVEEYQKDNQQDDKTVDQQRTETKQTITKLLKDNNLKSSDLPTEFHNWETELNKLDSKEKIKELQQKLEQAVKNFKNQPNNPQSSGDNKDKGLSLPVIGVGIAIVVLVLVGVIWHLIKKKKKNKTAEIATVILARTIY